MNQCFQSLTGSFFFPFLSLFLFAVSFSLVFLCISPLFSFFFFLVWSTQCQALFYLSKDGNGAGGGCFYESIFKVLSLVQASSGLQVNKIWVFCCFLGVSFYFFFHYRGGGSVIIQVACVCMHMAMKKDG